VSFAVGTGLVWLAWRWAGELNQQST
jgi:hypothetical protein